MSATIRSGRNFRDKPKKTFRYQFHEVNGISAWYHCLYLTPHPFFSRVAYQNERNLNWTGYFDSVFIFFLVLLLSYFSMERPFSLAIEWTEVVHIERQVYVTTKWHTMKILQPSTALRSKALLCRRLLLLSCFHNIKSIAFESFRYTHTHTLMCIVKMFHSNWQINVCLCFALASLSPPFGLTSSIVTKRFTRVV